MRKLPRKLPLVILIWLLITSLLLAYNIENLANKKPLQLIERVEYTQTPFDVMSINIPVHLEFQQHGGGYRYIPIESVKVTAYNNLTEQTNNQPNIGASTRKVFEGSVAVSRDILRDYKVKYGDILCLRQRGTCFFIEDTMNKRYDGDNGKHVDIFMYSKESARKVNYIDSAVILQQQ